jgi:hypothetical protein
MLVRNGAKMKMNQMGSVNVNPKALEEFLKEDCIEVAVKICN